MKRIITMLSLCAVITAVAEYRNRHTAEEWNTNSQYLNSSMKAAGVGWYVSPWFSAYYQTEDWWVYHCAKGWLYPESDGNMGVWLFWSKEDRWVWTRSDVYPLAYDSLDNIWFNFCVKDEEGIIAAN